VEFQEADMADLLFQTKMNVMNAFGETEAVEIRKK
jgi:hypothetical protein